MEDDLDEFLYGQSTAAAPAQDSPNASQPTKNSSAEDQEEEEYSEDDDELEIVLDESGNDIQPDPTSREALQLKPTQEGAVDGDTQPVVGGEKIDEVLPLKGHINISGIGEFNGRKILEIDLDAIEDKPWRKPGADITDYFNYGFNENSWRAYCIKQKQLREEVSLRENFDFGKMAPPSSYSSGHGGYSSQPPQKSYHGSSGGGGGLAGPESYSSSGRRSREGRRSRSPSRSRGDGRRSRDHSSDNYGRHRDDRYSKRRY